jgi:transposase InsO family protein
MTTLWHFQMSDFDVDQLRYLAQQISDGLMTSKVAATQVLNREHLPRRCERSTLTLAFKRFEIPYPQRGVGRPSLEPPPERVIEKISALYAYYPRGSTKMFFALQGDDIERELGCHVSEPMVELAYEVLGLWRFRYRELPAKKYRCCYEACQVYLVWHVDLHQPKDGSGGYYIAFLDDCSRCVVYAEYNETRPAAVSALALYTAILRGGGHDPYCIWSDNGTEFKGDFDAFLVGRSIEHVRTKPYNPEQNGKIERFWQNLDMRPKDVPLLDWIERYNGTECVSLPRVRTGRGVSVPMTPNQAHKGLPHWSRGDQGTWRVNGVERPFRHGDAAERAASAQAATQAATHAAEPKRRKIRTTS